MEFTTAEAKSGTVGSLRVLRVKETTFTVNWVAPAEVNGVLLTYTIRTNEEESSSADTEYNTVATSFSIHELVPYTPYVVSVAAINGASAGEPVSVVEFYTITVSREDVSSAIIINLDPNSEYCQLVQYREWAMSVLPWLYPLSHHAGMVGVIAGATAGLIVAVILLIIVCIVCIIRRRQHGGPKQESASRNPAYGMSVRQAPNDAVNVQSNDEHTYEHIRDIRVDEVAYETIDRDKNSGEGEAVMVSSNAAYGVRL